MLVSIYPGASRPDVLETLRGIHSKIGDATNVQDSAVARATAYLGWANDSVRMLEHRVSAADISRLVLTPGYERLLTATGILSGDDTATKGVLTGLLRREIERQGELLEEAIKGLEEQILRWPPNHLYAVADTSFYIKHEHKLEDIDFADLVQADDETIDRALAAQGLTGTTVTLLTFDTSQAARARNAGLDVNKLSKPLGEEPKDTRKEKV